MRPFQQELLSLVEEGQVLIKTDHDLMAAEVSLGEAGSQALDPAEQSELKTAWVDMEFAPGDQALMHSCSPKCHLTPDSDLRHGRRARVSIWPLDTSPWTSPLLLVLSMARTEVHVPWALLGVSVFHSSITVHPVARTRNL
ncbi:hypothetical protein CB1_000978038 [Camelus ferus]|nr:hypothetical protein CB1_000978038 [Camelus ferus]